MRVIYNKSTLNVVTSVEDDYSNISTPSYNSVFNGNLEEFEAFVRVQHDKEFGLKIENKFLATNKTMNIGFESSMELLQKFQTIGALLRYGDLTDAYTALLAVETDAELFTEERKSELILEMATYLGHI